MTIRVVHALNGIGDGGLQQAIYTLIDRGFYDGMDLKIVEMFRGTGHLRDKMAAKIGGENIISLMDRGGYTGPSARLTPRLLDALTGVFRRFRPNTIVLSHPYTNILGRMAAIPFRDLKVVAFDHDSYQGQKKIDFALRALSWRVDAVFGDTQKTLDGRAHAYLFQRAKYNVPLVMLEPGQPRGPERPVRFNILGSGRLAEQKNFGVLVEAVGMVIAEGRNVTLSIAGEGPERGKLETIIGDYDRRNPGRGVKERIRLLGWVDNRAEYAKLLDTSSFFAMTSHNEGLCIALIEAMARGVPSASTRFAGVRDYGTRDNLIIIPGEDRNGLISTTAAQVAGVIRNVMDNYAVMAPQLSTAGIETVRSRFSPQVVLPQWQPAIQEVASPRFPRVKEPCVLTHPSRVGAPHNV